MSFAPLRAVVALVASAVLGGAVAVGAVAALGGLDGGTTVVTETPSAASPGLAPRSGAAMTVHEIYERAASGVVRVNATSNSTSSSGTPSPFGAQGVSALGSGFVIDKTGHIVTNYHVVEVGRYVARSAPGGLRSGHAIAGFIAGIATMYVTGVLVA